MTAIDMAGGQNADCSPEAAAISNFGPIADIQKAPANVRLGAIKGHPPLRAPCSSAWRRLLCHRGTGSLPGSRHCYSA